VPKKDVVILDMSVEAAAKLIISAGLVLPPSQVEIAAGRKPAPMPERSRAPAGS
jgi:uncharacterized membrane protein